MRSDSKAQNNALDQPPHAAPESLGNSAANIDQAPSDSRNYQEIAKSLIKDVIEQVTGPLDSRVNVSVSTDPPLLILEHTAKSPKGSEHLFRYEINLESKKLTPGPLPELDKTSHLGFPAGPHSDRMLLAMQDTFRCACIHDPVLYGRFNRQELRLEDYQTRAVEGALSDLKETGRSLLVLGTGGGKTQIAFEIAAAELNRSPKLEDAVVVFVVNNNVILSEAGEKFIERFNETYSKSHAHGGKRDITGNVVFTTPGTLIGEGRLEELLASKKQVLFIFDEVHHVVATQPDEIIKRAMEFSKGSSTEVKFLGMTATETRPDLKSVLSYFNNHITYEQSAATLTSRGFLVPFRYHAHDSWLHPNNEAPACILPTDETAAERRQLLNSQEAFVHIENALDTHVRDRADRRTLIVAPSVDLAGQFKTYLNDNPDYKGTVVRLTAEDRAADPERFKDTYDAWKKGRWPKESRFAGEPVPEIVVAVDLFKEGADAPAVRTIINWGDTNSLIVFLQTLGRGLRPDPFKTNLEVIDIAGTFRKVHLLQWLGDAADPRQEQNGSPDDKERDGKERDEQAQTNGRPLCELSPEVSQSVQAFMADVAASITRRYPRHHYSAIPAEELEKLHSYIAQRCGFDTSHDFDNHLKDIATKLSTDSSMQTAQAARQKLLKAFYAADDSIPTDSQSIDREERTFLIHTHLSQTMQALRPDVTPQHIARVFPEFSLEALDAAKTIGGNLMTLRHRHFNLGPADMIQELLDSVVHKNRLAHDPSAEITLRSLENYRQDATGALLSVEARQMKRSFTPNGVPLEWEQRAVLLAFLEHPDVKGKLLESDFLRPRKDFENLLATQGLVTFRVTEASGDALRFVSTKLDEVAKAISSGDSTRIKTASGVANALLKELLGGVFLEEATITKYRFEELQNLQSAIEAASKPSPQLKELHKRLDAVIGKICKREVSEVSSVPGLTITTQQRPDVQLLEFAITRPAFEIKMAFPLRTELLRSHLLLPTGELQKMQLLYDALSPAAREDLIATMTAHIERFVANLSASSELNEAASPLVVVPSSTSPLFKDLGATLLRDTQLDVLRLGWRVSPHPGKYNLENSIDQALRSRVGYLTEENLFRLRQSAQSRSGESFAKELLHAYEVLHFARTRVAPHASQWKDLFENHTLGSESLRYVEAGKEPLTRLFEPDLTISVKRLQALKTYTNLLQGVSNSGGFTEESALLVAAWTAWDRVRFGTSDLRYCPLLPLNSEVPLFFTRLARAVQDGIEIPHPLKKATTEILSTLFEATHGEEHQRSPYLVGVLHQDQEREVTALKEKVQAISTTLHELLEKQAPQTTVDEAPAVKARLAGHPFFNAEREVVVFLSGTKTKPIMHLDPDCAARQKDMARLKKQVLPDGAVTLKTVDSTIGDRKVATCCKGCQTPAWREHEYYDDVKKRFVWSEQSVSLPNS